MGAGNSVLKTEHEEQREFVSWFRKRYPGVLIFAIPNGGHRSKATAARLKAEGVVPGVPDLCIPEWMVFIEMKRRKGGRLSKDQKNVMDQLQAAGYSCYVCAGADEAREVVLTITGEYE